VRLSLHYLSDPKLCAPTNSGYTKIYSSSEAFATLKPDGSITAWGYSDSERTDAPTDSGYSKIYSTSSAFAALKSDGSILLVGAPDPPYFELPQAVIEPSDLRAAKA
jgi:hypothetical protein